jgi:macrodomain Ter protein organizer (MatP/YcbG family)
MRPVPNRGTESCTYKKADGREFRKTSLDLEWPYVEMLKTIRMKTGKTLVVMVREMILERFAEVQKTVRTKTNATEN